MNVVGIDLAGAAKNPTGYCLLEGEQRIVQTRILHSDESIISNIADDEPEIVAVDAPLHYSGVNRRCDELLREYGVLPATVKGMEVLAKRGSKFYKTLTEKGIEAVEVKSKVSAQLLGVYAKNDFTMQKNLMGLDLSGDVNNKIMVRDELDAIVCALTGYLKLVGQVKTVGEGEETVTVPDI